jgi:phage baseplate assembly protein V
MIRFGTVTEVQASTGRVRVSFLEDNLVTQFLPVISAGSAGNKFFALPDVGDQVAVAMQDADVGVVLGAFYSSAQTPPSGSGPDIAMVEFSDGVVVKYDRGAKRLTISGEPNITVVADTVNVTASTIQIAVDEETEHDGDVIINGNLSVNGTMSSSGNLSVTGSVEATGEVTAKAGLASVSLSTHLHTSGGPGSPTTPPTAGT